MIEEFKKLILEGRGVDFLDVVSETLDQKALEVYNDVMLDVAPTMLEDVEQIDELSTDTLKSYAKKAGLQAKIRNSMYGTYARMADKEDNYDKSKYWESRAAKNKRIADKRRDGYDAAIDSLSDKGVRESYGDKKDYPKRHIHVDGEYVATTNWARTNKEARDKFLEKYPQHASKKVTIIKEDLNEELSDAAHELVLHADNDHTLHRTSHNPIIVTLKKKVANGTYDHEKAKKLWAQHADLAAQSYHKQFGSPGTKWHQMFSTADRKQAAAHFADSAREEYLKEDIEIFENYIDYLASLSESQIDEELSQLDEISKKKLSNYIDAATSSHRSASYSTGFNDSDSLENRKKAAKTNIASIKNSYKKRADDSDAIANSKFGEVERRERGIRLAGKKLAGLSKVPAKNPVGRLRKVAEDVEQIDELSTRKLLNYKEKAKESERSARKRVDYLGKTLNPDRDDVAPLEKAEDQVIKRSVGRQLAHSKIMGRAKVPSKD